MILVARGGNGEEDCWVWPFAKTKKGYGGSVLIAGKHSIPHRLSIIIDGKTIPKGMLVCHHCDNPPCVNPCHLYIGTDQDNVNDKMNRGRYRSVLDEEHHMQKLSVNDVGRIVDLRSTGMSSTEISNEFGVSTTTVKDICRGRLRKSALIRLGHDLSVMQEMYG